MPKTKAPAGALAGETVAFVGSFAYDLWLGELRRAGLPGLGAREVEPTDAPEILVAGQGRGGKPPGEVASVRKRHPAVTVLDVAGFARLALPEPDQLLREIARGRRDDRDRFWDHLAHQCDAAGRKIDLGGADLRKADLYGARLEGVRLDGADFRGATTQYTHFGDLRDANFDRADGPHVYLRGLTDCTFRKANLEKAWMFQGDGDRVAACDFTGARMAGARAERGTFADCTFARADLSDAELEESAFERCDFTGANLTRAHAHQARFDGAVLARADLTRADLRDASLANADLRGAVLRGAVLTGADLTGANVAGADFRDAVLTGAKTAGLDPAKAKNFRPPVVRTPGPKAAELGKAAAGAKEFETRAEVDLGEDGHASLELSAVARRGRVYISAWSRFHRGDSEVHDEIPAPSIPQGLLNLADRWPNAPLRLDTVSASGSRVVRGKKLQEVAAAAWAEAFGVTLATPEEIERRKAAQRAEATARRDALMRTVRKKGVKVWNALDFRERDRYDLRGVDLSGGKLSKINLWGREDLQDANFAGAELDEAELQNSALHRANFQNARLRATVLRYSKCEGASFAGADLSNAILNGTRLQGADLTGATLEGAELTGAEFDGQTKFPAGFELPEDMVWTGEGPRPGSRPARPAKVGSLDFDSFVRGLPKKVEYGRLRNATKMLTADRFQLFADVAEGAVVGVVKSQSDPDLVYACRLAADGRYSCGTQNLRPCGGLGGAVCKHLLVLILGLAKAGKLDPATADAWLGASRGHRPHLDKDAMSETFIRYKGAEAGEVDWRPTETIPEDFYAM